MNPHKLAKTKTEHGEQAALFSYLNMACAFGWEVADDQRAYEVKGWASAHATVAIPELAWVFAIPNGGSRGSNQNEAKRVGAMMKAEGVKRGVSDIFVPIPRHGLHGLFIELKREDGGSGLSKEQKAFGAFVRGQGYGFMQADGWKAAADAIKQWLGMPQIGS